MWTYCSYLGSNVKRRNSHSNYNWQKICSIYNFWLLEIPSRATSFLASSGKRIHNIDTVRKLSHNWDMTNKIRITFLLQLEEHNCCFWTSDKTFWWSSYLPFSYMCLDCLLLLLLLLLLCCFVVGVFTRVIKGMNEHHCFGKSIIRISQL
jgi:hypothetical protein